MEYYTSLATLLASGGMMSAVHNDAKGILVSPRALYFKQSLVKLRTVFPDSSDAYQVRSMRPPPLPFLRSSIPPSPAHGRIPCLSALSSAAFSVSPLHAAPLSHTPMNTLRCHVTSPYGTGPAWHGTGPAWPTRATTSCAVRRSTLETDRRRSRHCTS